MGTLSHLCHEELTLGWPWLAGGVAASICAVFLPIVDFPAFVSGAAMGINRWLPAAMVFLATGTIMRRSIGTGSANTRSALSPTVFSAKLIVIVLFLLLPVILVSLLNLATLGIRLSPLDWFLYVTEKFLIHAVFVAWTLPGSLFARSSISMAVVSGVTGGMGLSLFRWLEWSLQVDHGNMHESDGMHLASLALITLGMLLLVTLAMAFTWVRTLSLAISLVPLVSGTVILFVITRLLPYNFVEELSRDVGQDQAFDEKPEFQLKAVYPEVSASGMSLNGTVATVWTLPGRVAGLKSGWTADMREIVAIAESPDGATMKVKNAFGSKRTLDHPLVLATVQRKGFKGDADSLSKNEYSPHAVFQWEGSHPSKADIDGTARFFLYRERVLAELPFEEGAKATWDRFVCKITRITRPGDKTEAAFKISIRGAAIASRGDAARDLRSGGIRIVLANPVTNELMWVDEDRPSFFIHQDWFTWRKVITANSIMGDDGYRRNIHSSSPDDFLKDARLYVIGTDHAGTIDLPYQIKGMKLDRE